MDNTATLRQEIKQLMVENLMLQSEEADLFVAACLRGCFFPTHCSILTRAFRSTVNFIAWCVLAVSGGDYFRGDRGVA